MKRIIITLEEGQNLSKNDLIVYNGHHYVTISKTAFLKENIEDIYKLFKEVESLSKRVSDIEKQLAYDHGEVD